MFQPRLDQLFDLTTPGEYLIYTRRLIQKMDRKGVTKAVSGNATIRIVNAPKAAGQANPGNTTTTTTSPSPTAPARSRTLSMFGAPLSANSQPPANAAAPESAANKPKNILRPAPKAATNTTPAQLAQAETGAGWFTRDWVYGLLVLGLLLGIGWYLFRVRSPHPRG